MKQLHRQEKEQFKKLFKEERIDQFDNRFKVLESFLQTEQHVTAASLSRRMEETGGRFSQEFVEDTLEHLCRFGFAQKNRFDNGEFYYEHLHLGQHHDHMICTKCRKIIEFKDDQMESLQLKICNTHGFHMLQHKMEIYGICSECLGDPDQMIPLSSARQGEQLVIAGFIGGSGARLRLLSMGLRQGDRLQVITNQSSGQVVVAVGFNRFVLGRGLAGKILVRPDGTR
jgi:Fur family ferric uptake transcriptional regulator